MCSLSAHGTCYWFVNLIRRAVESMKTVCSHTEEFIAMLVISMTGKCFHLSVHANEVMLGVVIVSSHQKPVVLACPAVRTRVVSGYHEGCGSHLHSTNGARNIAVLDVLLSWIELINGLILGPMNIGSTKVADTRNILGIKRQTKMVTTTTSDAEVRPSHGSFVDKGRSRWTGIVTPSCVGGALLF